MNRKLIVLNVVLLALAGWFFWMLRLKWIELHKHEHTVLALSPAVQKRLAPPVPMQLPNKMLSVDYNEIVQRTLFAKDRNPNVIVDPPPAPPPPPPPPPMPALPAYYGSINFGDPIVLLKLPKGVQKQYHAGEKVGPFQLVSFDREKIVFDWDGKKVERKPEELKEKEAAPQEAAAAPVQQPVAPAASASGVKSIGGEKNDTLKDSEKLGPQNGDIRQCVTGDTSPVGTVIDGFKKKITTNMFGQTCMWEPVNP